MKTLLDKHFIRSQTAIFIMFNHKKIIIVALTNDQLIIIAVV
jgi:hypothetical protein